MHLVPLLLGIALAEPHSSEQTVFAQELVIQSRPDVDKKQQQQQRPAQTVKRAEEEAAALPEASFEAPRSDHPARELSRTGRLPRLGSCGWRHLPRLKTA